MRLHGGGPLVRRGAAPGEAGAALVALHGRGASAEGIAAFLATELLLPADVALVAPQASGSTWYPQSFLAPREANEPWLSSALARAEEVLEDLAREGVPRERVLLFGFSQGACLASELVATRPRRYLGLVAAVGGRIGPPGTRFASAGDLAGTPVLFAAGDPDPHVPWVRVEESAANFRALGAEVTLERLPGFPHAVPPGALSFASRLIAPR